MDTTPVIALDLAQTASIGSMVMLVALVAIVAFVGLSVYRTRHSATRETHYRTLAEQATTAEARFADGTQATVVELQGVRAELKNTHTELAAVKQRLAALEKLLSQIG
ncbi:hypothetical protein GCM10027280_13440 [Micromonospora polyrhachis]|uniref:Outer membrane protein TolC n=1 Tax=Micromonospora polyrhachis TaxID=1282883 RepID=A0A7W7WQQ4_9ACTN|nr:hypothetical protein [Micromonospora polyrhachis]MBB4960079.1 outer membrane protein TolC [Micromonospora polyrhachis]